MNKKLIAGGAITGVALAGGFAAMVSAQTVADATNLTEEQVIEIALLEVPGEVEEVALENHRGRQFFEVEVIAADGGEEVEIRIDADSGEVLKVKADDDDCDDDDEDGEDA